jgi:conjugative relaxase-like TrwC/TraI family protein
MGLARMAPDGWAYYAREIAAGVEDYFAGHLEEKGRWVGRGAEALGLSGQTNSDALSRLFGHGLHPATGSSLGGPFTSGSKTVAGYALSFSPPKSVSILWALAPTETASEVRAGHEAAVATALEFLQDHAAFTRRGHGGMVQEPTRGYVAAAFTHRTSRAGDPQLHSHVLVANKVQAVSDGRWLALDGRELYEVQKAAGMIYKAALRAELSARLGVARGEVDVDGGAEIVGVPEGLIAMFSKRRAQVEAAAARLAGEKETVLGRSLTDDERAAVFQMAAYQSRAAKGDGGETTGELRARWGGEAAAAGAPVDRWLRDVFTPHMSAGREPQWSRPGVRCPGDLILAEVVEVLEAKHSTWGRAQLIEALSVVLPTAQLDGAERVRVVLEAAADAVLARSEVAMLTCPDRPDCRHGGLRYSTWWTLRTEQAVLDVVEAGPDRSNISRIRPSNRDGRGRPRRRPGRRGAADMRRRGAGGGAGGPGRIGQVGQLGRGSPAPTASGVCVRGVAPSAVAAGVLAEQAHIPSETLTRFLLDAARGRTQLQPGEVIDCDEASMVSTRDLAQLVLHAEAAEAKVVLVGDHYQLGSVDAGGLFRLLATDAKTAELTTIRRFADPWEAQASGRLRRRDPSVIDEYIDRGRVRAADRDGALDAAHQAWLDARREDRSVLVMAVDHDTVDQLALRARATRVASGEVEPEGIILSGQPVGVGDDIVTAGNDRRLVTTTGAWVRNGDRWQVHARDRNGALHLASLQRRGKVTLPADYVHDHVALAYAVTVHKAQGVTVDDAVLVVDRATAAEHLYVGMTRGRHNNLACVVTEPAGDEHQHRQAPTASEVLAIALRKTSNEKSATEILRDELDRQGRSAEGRAAIVEGLRQTYAHSLNQAIRRQTKRQPFMAAESSAVLEPTNYRGVEL